MSGDRRLPGIDAAREIFGLTLEEIASSVRADYATLYRWREGATPTVVFRDRLDRLQELADEVLRSVGRERALEWLNTGVGALGGKSPREMILAGRAETVLGVLLGYNHLLGTLRSAEPRPEGQGGKLPDGQREPLAIRRAREYGIDIGRLRVMLQRDPGERLRSLDENLRFFQLARPTGKRPC